MRVSGLTARHHRFWTLLSVAGLAFCDGCGSGAGPTGTVSGTVTFNGQPVPAGTTVAFVSDKGYTAAGVVEKEGRYQLLTGKRDKHIPAASYQATVSPPANEMSEAEYSAMMQASGSKARLAPRPTEMPVIPPKYFNKATSGLSFTVVKGKNTFDIKLEQPPPPVRRWR